MGYSKKLEGHNHKIQQQNQLTENSKFMIKIRFLGAMSEVDWRENTARKEAS